jgi:hypothetical protein
MYTRDMRTVHADLFGGPPGYLMNEAEELSALRSFVRDQRSEAARSHRVVPAAGEAPEELS